MLEVDNDKVYIEHCQNCSTHNWCTKHDESKYISYFENCKAKILVVCPEVQVLCNQVPLFLLSKLSSSQPKGKNPSFPRIGSFEIYFKSVTIFSKLESGQWPQSTLIANKIRELIDKPTSHHVHELQTNLLPKRKIKRDIKSIEPSSSRNLAGRFKSTTPNRKKKKSEYFRRDKRQEESAEDEDEDERVNKKMARGKSGNRNKDERALNQGKIRANREIEQDSEFEGLQVTKEYELELQFDGLSNKKINYSNKSNNDCDFRVFSSDPVNMMVKEEHVVVKAGEVGKFQLRFPPMDEPCYRVYLLKVLNFGQIWECFKFKVRYD